jgi:hypothetical protein
MAQKVNIISMSSDVFHIFSVFLRKKEWIATFALLSRNDGRGCG